MLNSCGMNEVTLCCHQPAFLKRKHCHFCCLGKSLSLLSHQHSCQTPHKSRGMMVVWLQSSKGGICAWFLLRCLQTASMMLEVRMMNEVLLNPCLCLPDQQLSFPSN